MWEHHKSIRDQAIHKVLFENKDAVISSTEGGC